MIGRKIIFWGRWLLGLALIALLLFKIRWRPILEVLKDLSWPYLFALAGLSFLLIYVSCVKWRLFLAGSKRPVSLWDLMALYLVGYFFNNFLPSQYGGDLVRSYELGRDIDCQATSFTSVFMERYTGLIALMATSGGAALFMPSLVAEAKLGLPFALAWAAFLFSLWLIIDRRPVDFMMKRFSGNLWRKAAGIFTALYDEVHSSGQRPGLISRALLLSLLFHVLTVVNVYLAILALRLRAHFFPLMVVVPLILLVSMIPLTVNSIGLFEGAFVYFLGLLGLTAAEAMSVALILRAKNIALAVLGGLVYLARSRRGH